MPEPLTNPEAAAQKIIRQRQRAMKVDKQSLLPEPLALAMNHLPGGWRGFAAIFRLLPEIDDERLHILNCYVSLERKVRLVRNGSSAQVPEITPEMVCEIAGVTPGHFIALVTESAYVANLPVSGLMLGGRHPEVMKAMIDSACMPEGVRDREMIMRATGILPTPASSQITNQIFNSNKSSASAASVGDDGSLEPFESSTLRISEVLRAATDRQLLESPSKTLDVAFSSANPPVKE